MLLIRADRGKIRTSAFEAGGMNWATSKFSCAQRVAAESPGLTVNASERTLMPLSHTGETFTLRWGRPSGLKVAPRSLRDGASGRP